MRTVFSLWHRYPHHAAWGVIGLATLLRLWFIFSGQLDLVQDEAQYWDWSRRLDLAYYSKGPLIAWVIAFFTAIMGDTEAAVRFGAVLGSLLAQSILYLGISRLFRRPRLASLTLLVANTTPLFLASGILMTTDNPLLVCWLAGFFSLHAAVRYPDARWPWVTLVLAMALGILAKYTMLALGGIALLHAWGLYCRGMLPHGHLRRLCIALACGVILGMLPIVVWNAANDWASFRHVGRLAGIAPALSDQAPLIRFDRFPEYIGSQLGLLFPWWLAFMLVGAYRSFTRYCPWKSWLPPGWMHALLPAGLGDSGGHGDPVNLGSPHTSEGKRETTRQHILLCVGFWPLWIFFILWSFHTRIYANWSAMSYAAGCILAGTVLEELFHPQAGDAGRWRWRLAAVCCLALSLVLSAGIYAQEPLSRFLPERYNPAARLKGWNDLGRHLDSIRRSMPNPDRVFFFSDSYDVTAALAFYVPGRPVTFCADFGRRLSQYDIWPSPEDKKGWDAIFVRRKPFDKADPLLTAMFLRLGKPEAYQSTHRGADGREFGIMVLHDFTGAWPRTSKGIY